MGIQKWVGVFHVSNKLFQENAKTTLRPQNPPSDLHSSFVSKASQLPDELLAPVNDKTPNRVSLECCGIIQDISRSGLYVSLCCQCNANVKNWTFQVRLQNNKQKDSLNIFDSLLSSLCPLLRLYVHHLGLLAVDGLSAKHAEAASVFFWGCAGVIDIL